MLTNSLVENILGYITISISSLTIIINICLFYPTLSIKNPFPPFIFLFCQLLICSIICAIYLILNGFQKMFSVFPCEMILIFRNLSSIPIVSTSLCICISNLLVIRRSNLLKNNYKKLIVIFLLVIWVFPISIVISLFIMINIYNLKFTETNCVVNSFRGYSWLYYISVVGYYFGTLIVCVQIIVKLIMINKHVPNQTTKKLIKAVSSHFIGLFFFSSFDIVTESIRSNTHLSAVRTILLMCISIMNLIMIYLFIWTKKVSSNCYALYCCCLSLFKKDEASEFRGVNWEHNYATVNDGQEETDSD